MRGNLRAGKFEGEPKFTPVDEGGKLLDVRFEHSTQLWPWSGFLALYIRVRAEGSTFNGTASGTVNFTIVSPPMPGETELRRSTVLLPINVAVIPTPPRCRIQPLPCACRFQALVGLVPLSSYVHVAVLLA